MSELIHLAQNVARQWPAFPCGADKSPCIGKKEGGKGFHDASQDPETINRLFSHRYAALIGIPTGVASNFDVLDVDVKHAAARAWLTVAGARVPATRTYQTRSGGFHILFRHAVGVHNTESNIAKGIDTRGEGGYIVFWYGAGFPCTDHSPIAEWPEWLLEALFYKPTPEVVPARTSRPFQSSGTSAQNIIAATIRTLRNAPDGGRHAALRAAACTLGGVMVAANLSTARAIELLLDAVIAAGGERVDRKNAEGTIEWGLEKGATTPLALGAD